MVCFRSASVPRDSSVIGTVLCRLAIIREPLKYRTCVGLGGHRASIDVTVSGQLAMVIVAGVNGETIASAYFICADISSHALLISMRRPQTVVSSIFRFSVFIRTNPVFPYL